MARARTLVLNTKVDVTGADKLKGLGDRLKGALNPTNIAKGLAGGFLASEAFQFFDNAINAAAEFQDTVGATGVIIGQELQAPMEEWAETASEAFGASKQQALEAANQMAVFGKAAGLAGEDLFDFAQEMTQLGGDLASFFGGSTEEAITAVGSALRGEFEPIRRYGVLLDDATLRQKAFEMGLIDSTKNALTPQQKTLAAQAAILEQTADAQGDFARTSDGMANTQRRLAAEMENVTIELGEKLLPVALEFAKFVSDVLIPGLKLFIDVGGAVGGVFGAIGDAMNTFVGSGVAINDFFTGLDRDRVQRFADTTGESFDEVRDRVRDRMKESGETFDEVMGSMEARTAAMNIPETMDEGMRATHQVVRDIGAEIKAEWEGVADSLPKAVHDRFAKVRAAGFQQQVEYAKGLLDGQNNVKVAIEAAMQIAEEEMSRAEEIAYLEGQRGSLNLARGIASAEGKTATVAAIDGALGLVRQRLGVLGVEFYGFGKNSGHALARGLDDSRGVVRTAAGRLAQAIEGQIGIRSEPKDPNSPLRGITQFGGNLVNTYAEGMRKRISTLRRVASEVAAAVTPPVGGGLAMAMTPAGIASLPSGGGPSVVNNFYLQWDGEPPQGRDESEIMANLQRLASVTRTWG